jgi:hypothetical protein
MAMGFTVLVTLGLLKTFMRWEKEKDEILSKFLH